MRPPRPLLGSFPPCALSLAVAASLAAASHVAPVLPLSSNSNHSHERFSPTNFKAGNYSNYDFSFADLSGCTFAAGSNLSGANFRGANLTNANFNDSNLDRADFTGANLANAFVPCMGGGNFSGAILTGAVGGGEGCAGCGQWGPNVIDDCTVGPLPALCLAPYGFRGLVAGVVFSDVNLNGQLDFGEPGVPGAEVTFSAIPFATSTDSRGAFWVGSSQPSFGLVGVVLPAGWVFVGGAGCGTGSTACARSYNLAVCRSVQQLTFPVTTPEVPALRSSFGRVKAMFR